MPWQTGWSVQAQRGRCEKRGSFSPFLPLLPSWVQLLSHISLWHKTNELIANMVINSGDLITQCTSACCLPSPLVSPWLSVVQAQRLALIYAYPEPQHIKIIIRLKSRSRHLLKPFNLISLHYTLASFGMWESVSPMPYPSFACRVSPLRVYFLIHQNGKF